MARGEPTGLPRPQSPGNTRPLKHTHDITLGKGARHAQDLGVTFELIMVRRVVERAMGRENNGTISGRAATARRTHSLRV